MQSESLSGSPVDISVVETEPPLSRPSELSIRQAPEPLSPKLDDLVGSASWKDWPWQMRNRIRTVQRLKEFFPSLPLAPGLAAAAETFPLAITPYYASLIRSLDDADPIFRMSVPQVQELWNPPFLQPDPLDEDHHMPVPGLVHRYPDRALLIATSACAMYCRHCTRKRVTGMKETGLSPSRLKRSVEYLAAHPEIRDVIVSGGDPFTLATDTLELILSSLRSVPSLDVIRFGSRTPVTLPYRITDELTAMLRKYHPIWLNTHFNHPSEITPEAAEACARLADAGVPLGNQSVLLRGINDDPQVMEDLLRRLVRIRVRPYYIFQCDLVKGVEHFRTPLSRGIEIMEYLRGRISGIAIPSFVVDLPQGGGKVPVLPSYVVSASPTHTILRSIDGQSVSYPEPYAGSPRAGGPSPVQTAWTWDLDRKPSPPSSSADADTDAPGNGVPAGDEVP